MLQSTDTQNYYQENFSSAMQVPVNEPLLRNKRTNIILSLQLVKPLPNNKEQQQGLTQLIYNVYSATNI